jgi:hypothetical protein
MIPPFDMLCLRISAIQAMLHPEKEPVPFRGENEKDQVLLFSETGSS